MADKRIYGKTKQIDTEQLKTVFSSLPYVQVALLFGSRATGKSHSRSDYDFAVLLDHVPQESWGILSKVWSDLTEQLGLGDEDMDIADLERADNVLLQSISEGYIILKGDPNGVQCLLGKNTQDR